MTSIMVYDDTAKALKELAVKWYVSVAEIVDTLVSDYGEELGNGTE